jgi:hypothetical protein
MRYKRPRDLIGDIIPDTPEKVIQRSVIAELRRMRIKHWRANSGVVWIKKKGYPDFPMTVNFKGCPDILGYLRPNGRLFGIEVKTRTGKQSPEQEACQRSFEEEGALYILARSVDDVLEALKKFEPRINSASTHAADGVREAL